ncbi:MAG TPA: hypothetical protein PKG95_01050 [Anaerolineaceae bacterium]|jgi:16S rRNA (guanine(1405)-N(7))-methyltransferase|nr:hypothetical protein [Anaerolineaceae bacterium]
MPTELAALVAELRSLRKYRDLDLPEETVRDLLEQELPHYRNERDALKAVRQKLHNIVAPYLGDPDYAAAALQLSTAQAAGPEQLHSACIDIMGTHASTRERVPVLTEFYTRLFAITGHPQVVLDLACGLHPLGLPWMHLPPAVSYHAYDLHRPRIGLINHFLGLQGLPQLAEQRDILVQPPEIEADLAFFFKEAHRFEQRQRGCNRTFWLSLRVRWLVVSLPAADLTGHHSLVDKHRQLVHDTIQGLPWEVTELQVGNELLFCVKITP